MSKFAEVFAKVQEKRKPKPASQAPANASYGKISAEVLKADKILEQKLTSIKNSTPQDHVVMLRHPDSMPAEQYRMLRTSLKAELQKQNAKVIMMTSSTNGEGKTVSSTNLAIALAEDSSVRVLLIDADLRKGHVADYLGFGKRAGLSEMFSEDLNPKKIMLKNSLPNLVVIPCGSPHKKPSELISSEKFRTFIHSLRSHFDYILIDSPPVMAVADTPMLASLADGVLFVIQLGRTPKSVISQAQQLLEQAGAKIFGHLLTHVEYSTFEYRYQQHYGYGYNKDGKKKPMSVKASIRKSAVYLRDLEEKFNLWWEKKLSKKAVDRSNGVRE